LAGATLVQFDGDQKNALESHRIASLESGRRAASAAVAKVTYLGRRASCDVRYDEFQPFRHVTGFSTRCGIIGGQTFVVQYLHTGPHSVMARRHWTNPINRSWDGEKTASAVAAV